MNLRRNFNAPNRMYINRTNLSKVDNSNTPMPFYVAKSNRPVYSASTSLKPASTKANNSISNSSTAYKHFIYVHGNV
jgi:hypothetical protein